MSKNINEMNYYELAKEVHANAVAKGFWDKAMSIRHYLMLVICELAEAIEADREGRTASIPEGIESFPDKAFIPSFKSYIKDTVEDELADAVIRLLDIWVEAFPNEEMHVTAAYMVEKQTLTEVASMVSEYLLDKEIYSFLEVNLLCGNRLKVCMDRAIDMLYSYAKNKGIDLDRHILLKMRYNATRPRLHGKKY